MNYPISDGWYTGEVADDLLRSIDEANDRDWDYAYEEEGEAEASARMNETERIADDCYQKEMATMTDFYLEPIDPSELSALDLQQELQQAESDCGPAETYRLRMAEGNPSVGNLLYYPQIGRAGVEWGADAIWTDCSSAEDAVRRVMEGDVIP
jgi:hypothetical protein